MKFIAALVALVATTTFATDLPAGAHDTRPPQPRPNVCDDKCDISFLKHYDSCKNRLDCVATARKQTCKADYSCSSSCGYTAEGCANPAGWKPSEVATSANITTTATTSCSNKIVATSIVTLTSTIQRSVLDAGRMDLVAAKTLTTVDGGVGAAEVSTVANSQSPATTLTSTMKPTSALETMPSSTGDPHHGVAGELEASALALVGALAVALVL